MRNSLVFINGSDWIQIKRQTYELLDWIWRKCDMTLSISGGNFYIELRFEPRLWRGRDNDATEYDCQMVMVSEHPGVSLGDRIESSLVVVPDTLKWSAPQIEGIRSDSVLQIVAWELAPHLLVFPGAPFEIENSPLHYHDEKNPERLMRFCYRSNHGK